LQGKQGLSRLNKRILGIILIALSVVFTVGLSYSLLGQSNHPEIPTIDKINEFFSSVVGLDMSKYILTDISPIYTEGMPSDFRVNYTALESTF